MKRLCWVALLLGVMSGCHHGQTQLSRMAGENSPPMSMHVISPAFGDAQPIPMKYANADNISPPLMWSNPPAETKSFALLVEDPDAPGVHPFVHWIIYNIPANETQLNERIPPREQLNRPRGAQQGKNSASTIGYFHPAPPAGDQPHHYHFQLFALSQMLENKSSQPMARAEFLRQITGHVLATGQLIGTYQQPANSR